VSLFVFQCLTWYSEQAYSPTGWRYRDSKERSDWQMLFVFQKEAQRQYLAAGTVITFQWLEKFK